MEDFFQHFRTLSASLAASSIVIVGAALYFSSSAMLESSLIDLRNSPLIPAVGAVIAGVHGLFTGCFLIWRKSDSIGDSLTASISAMEIVALLICLTIPLLFWASGVFGQLNPKGITFLIGLFFELARLFLRVSVVLFVPALLIGFVNRYFLSLFR